MNIIKKIVAIMLLTTILNTTNAAEVGELEIVTEFTDTRGGGITITPAGRILISMHPLDNPKLKIVEVMANGSKQPFPNMDWADGPETGDVGLTSVIGIHSDSNGVVWILDMGSENQPAQLIGWDSVAHKLTNLIEIHPDGLVPNSFLQDFVLDEKRQKIYIADMSFGNFNGATRPAIVVVDLNTGTTRRLLEGTKTFMPIDRDTVIDAVTLASKSESDEVTKIRFGLNPIAIDEDYEWVYYGALSGETIYRIPASVLASDTMTDNQRAKKIKEYGPKHFSDGIAYFGDGSILATDLENNAIGLTTKGNYKIIIQDKRLSWPDSLALSNGYVYVTQDQLHLHPAFSKGMGNAKAPYILMRFKYRQ